MSLEPKNLNPIDGMSGKQWAVLLHISQLFGYAVPLAGFVVPILIWRLKRDQFPELEAHGLIVVNWIISSLIYFTVAVLASFFLIGLPFFFVLVLMSVIYPVVGCIKANDGVVWTYPGTIRFLK